MHAAYEEEDERVLQHAGEEELACHCRLRPRGGGAHCGCGTNFEKKLIKALPKSNVYVYLYSFLLSLTNLI